jgi:hypothetical protein
MQINSLTGIKTLNIDSGTIQMSTIIQINSEEDYKVKHSTVP